MYSYKIEAVTIIGPYNYTVDLKFKPLFVKTVKSLYRNITSLRTVDQYEAVTSLENWEEMEDNSNSHRVILNTNPCHHGYPFAGVEATGML